MASGSRMSARTRAAGLRPRSCNTVLYVSRFAQCVGFYRETLGLRVRFERDWFVEFEVAGGARLSVADQRRCTIASGGGAGITLTFEVETLDEVHRWLEERGAAPGPICKRFGARVCYLRDPEGHRLEFWSAAPVTMPP